MDIPSLLTSRFSRLNLPPPSAFQGKTILITGANTGLGKEAARHALALQASTIIMGVRNIAKGEDAKTDIVSSTKNFSDKQNVLVWPLDLESFASVQAFAAKVRKHVEIDGGRLDMAIMNAGLASGDFVTTADGWERTIQVNVLSTTLLSLLLLPLLLRTAEQYPSSRPHLSIMASDVHKLVRFSERHGDAILARLNDQDQWERSQKAGGPVERYGVTKLLDIFVAIEIARLVPHSPNADPLVVVNSLTPGFCKSDLLTREEAPLMLKVAQTLLARTVATGSKTLLHAATAGPETHGHWLENQAVADPGKMVTDSEATVTRQRVWAEITTTLKSVAPELQTKY